MTCIAHNPFLKGSGGSKGGYPGGGELLDLNY